MVSARLDEIRQLHSHGEYRSRLVARDIKMDKRFDLFAALAPSEAKKILFGAAVAEGIGFHTWVRECGMKIDFVDISRVFSG